MKIALLQLLPTGTLEGQLEKGLEACRHGGGYCPVSGDVELRI